jgi:hypothetical protein
MSPAVGPLALRRLLQDTGDGLRHDLRAQHFPGTSLTRLLPDILPIAGAAIDAPN